MNRLVGQRAGRAGGDALTAGHAGRRAHRVAQVERDERAEPLAAAPDHVVALDVVAGPGAPVAQDAGVVIDRDDRARQVHAAPGTARQAVVARSPRTGRPARAARCRRSWSAWGRPRAAAGRTAAAWSAWRGCARPPGCRSSPACRSRRPARRTRRTRARRCRPRTSGRRRRGRIARRGRARGCRSRQPWPPAQIVVPSGAVTSRPSIVSVTVRVLSGAVIAILGSIRPVRGKANSRSTLD